MPLSERVHCVGVIFKTRAEPWICIKFCMKLEHSSVETIWIIQKAAAVGSWWLAASSQRARSWVTSCAVFWLNIKSPRWLRPPTAQIWCPATSAFPKTKTPFEREEISDQWWDSGKYNGAADGNWENSVRSQELTLKGTEAPLTYVQCFLYIVSSSINASTFPNTWLDTFWTDLI